MRHNYSPESAMPHGSHTYMAFVENALCAQHNFSHHHLLMKCESELSVSTGGRHGTRDGIFPLPARMTDGYMLTIPGEVLWPRGEPVLGSAAAIYGTSNAVPAGPSGCGGLQSELSAALPTAQRSWRPLGRRSTGRTAAAAALQPQECQRSRPGPGSDANLGQRLGQTTDSAHRG